MRTTGLYGTGLAIILAVTLGTATKANAQLTLLNATGYGVIGFGAGAGAGALVGGTECHGDYFCLPPGMVIGSLAGLVTGIVAGRKMALRADRKVRDGEALTGGHRAALAVGSVIGGAILGVMIGGQVEQNTGSIIGMVAGAGLSVRYLRSRWGSFEGLPVQVRPAIVGGEAGVTARIRF